MGFCSPPTFSTQKHAALRPAAGESGRMLARRQADAHRHVGGLVRPSKVLLVLRQLTGAAGGDDALGVNHPDGLNQEHQGHRPSTQPHHQVEMLRCVDLNLHQHHETLAVDLQILLRRQIRDAAVMATRHSKYGLKDRFLGFILDPGT